MDSYTELRVAHTLGGLPTARVTHGRDVVHKTFGITRLHALGRAAQWARDHSTGVVYVMKCGEPRRSVLGAPLPPRGQSS